MNQSVYSWYGSPIQIVLTDDNADAYNRVMDCLQKLPNDFDIFGRGVKLDVTKQDLAVYNKIAGIINEIIDLAGGSLPFGPNDFGPSIHMEKVN